MKKVIAIAGKNNIAVNIVKYIILNYPDVELVTCVNENDQSENNFQLSFKKFCELNNIRILRLEELYDIHDLIFLSLEFDKIIKPQLFKSKSLFNIHFSLLPAYKGMYTSAHPLLNNEFYSGVTLHMIDDGIDTGDIIDQTKFEIDNILNAQELYLKYIDEGIKLIVKNFNLLLRGDFTAKPQSKYGSSYYSKKSIDYSNIQINLNKTAEEIFNQIRAFTFPAYQMPCVLGIPVYKSEITSSRSKMKSGNVIFENDFKFILSTIDYDIIIYKYRIIELLEAARQNNLEFIKYLVSNSYPINQKNKQGWDALIVATYNGSLETVKYLVEDYNFDLNTKNYNGTTLAMYAMTNSSITDDMKMLKYFLSYHRHKMDLSVLDYEGKDILFYANKLGNRQILRLLEND